MRELSGVRFGSLLVGTYALDGKWLCFCDCGSEITVLTNNLTRGNSTSCGCKRRAKHFKHGMSKTKIYQAWKQMFQRCRNPNDAAYANYGGRGINVCKEWEDFNQFIADMGMRPAGMQLDRVNNELGYCKENCKWVSAQTNLNNRRDSNRVTYKGETLTLAQWSVITGISARTLTKRKAKGLSPDEMFDVASRIGTNQFSTKRLTKTVKLNKE